MRKTGLVIEFERSNKGSKCVVGGTQILSSMIWEIGNKNSCKGNVQID